MSECERFDLAYFEAKNATRLAANPTYAGILERWKLHRLDGHAECRICQIGVRTLRGWEDGLDKASSAVAWRAANPSKVADETAKGNEIDRARRQATELVLKGE